MLEGAESTLQRDESAMELAERVSGVVEYVLRVGATLPFLGGPCEVLGEILGDASELFGKSHDMIAVARKALDIIDYLSELPEIVQSMGEDDRARVERDMGPLTSLLSDLRGVVNSYGEKGFLKRMWSMRRHTESPNRSINCSRSCSERTIWRGTSR